MCIVRDMNDTPVVTTPSTQMSAVPEPKSLPLFKPTCCTAASLEQQQAEVFQRFQLSVNCSQVLNHSNLHKEHI